MKKLLKEALAILLTLGIAAGIILLLFSQNAPRYDTFAGTIAKTPINITSPVYGQILALPLHEGDHVKKGQTLAILHVLNLSALPAPSALYPITGTQMRILSPTDGVIGAITFATFSTVAGAQTLLLLYTTSSLEIQVLLPATATLTNYAAFYAERPPARNRYLLHIVEQIPTNVISNIDPTMSVYRATCTECAALLNNETIAILAERVQQPSPLDEAWQTLHTHF
jgi:hypothetical protein